MSSGTVTSETVSCLDVGYMLRRSLHTVGNLHLNIVAEAYTPEIEAALEPFVYELVGEWTRGCRAFAL